VKAAGRILRIATALLGAACGHAPAPASAPEGAPGAPRLDAQALARPLDAWVHEPRHHGVSAAVIGPDASLWAGTAGLARTGEPLSPDHHLAIGSITKTVTAALVLQLVDEGHLRLDDAVSRWRPGLPHVPPEVTLRQLMNHTAGLANYTLHPAYAPTLAADPGRWFAPEEVLALFLGPPVFGPGERTEYTNTSFLVLGLVAEAAGDLDVAKAWRRRFWTPLGLPDVFLPPDEAPSGPVANAWVSGPDAAVLDTDPLGDVAACSTRWAAFGLFAAPRDVARWGRALFAGGVLSSASRAEMLRFEPPAPGTLETGSGLGVRRYAFFGREQWGHSGATDVGSSILVYEPSSGITVAVAMNQPPASHGSSHFALAAELLRLSR
jgi:D-alanyl-D-alanine carboxypeptidase